MPHVGAPIPRTLVEPHPGHEPRHRTAELHPQLHRPSVIRRRRDRRRHRAVPQTARTPRPWSGDRQRDGRGMWTARRGGSGDRHRRGSSGRTRRRGERQRRATARVHTRRVEAGGHTAAGSPVAASETDSGALMAVVVIVDVPLAPRVNGEAGRRRGRPRSRLVASSPSARRSWYVDRPTRRLPSSSPSRRSPSGLALDDLQVDVDVELPPEFTLRRVEAGAVAPLGSPLAASETVSGCVDGCRVS